MNKSIFISGFFLLLTHNLLGQVNDDSIRQVVLNQNVKDSLYIFGQWKETGGTETHLNYLGEIETQNGNFKIMTSSWFWGLSKRATNRILVFDEKNRYLGNYYVGMIHELPEKIENNQIVFLHSRCDECKEEIITHLSFENGVPEQFFQECKEGYGDIYTFDKE